MYGLSDMCLTSGDFCYVADTYKLVKQYMGNEEISDSRGSYPLGMSTRTVATRYRRLLAPSPSWRRESTTGRPQLCRGWSGIFLVAGKGEAGVFRDPPNSKLISTTYLEKVTDNPNEWYST
ncbi:hypothetical protein E2C01_003743 [Portunus trituberculatus]|uniref:Uncharacterized protein n=1 Tax=Portunus trituberculatus TaxID=210409 RepID=A0A5B7CNH9_PORTR|nr:hypothetical protein [Portunus trituberculatus]